MNSFRTLPAPRARGPFRARFPLRATGAAVLLAALGLVLGTLAPLAAQPTPDPLFRDFEETGAYEVKIDGKTADADVYESERARAVLVMSSELDSPVIINLRSRQVETVGLMSLAKGPGGSLAVLADARMSPVGQFAVADQGVSFTFGGKEVNLTARESLTGRQEGENLAEYDPAYARGAEAYDPSKALVAQLREHDEPVRVQVFFNSKCAICKQMVPRIIKVERALEGSRIAFDYYGVPDSYSGDPEMEKKDIHGVPTGIVYVNGKEVGRISGGEWRMPELALKNLLLKS